MAENSKIEWTHHTANLWWGCTKVHDGCDNCYALTFAKRVGNDVWGEDKPRRQIKDVWQKLKQFQKQAEAVGEVHRVFVGSMQDIFEKPKPLVDHKGVPYVPGDSEFWNTGQLREKFFNEVVPNSPNLMFLLLTKRPSNINKYIPQRWKSNPPENVMYGTSPVNQKTADDLISQLAKVNGKRFISLEPQLDEVNLLAKIKNTDRSLLETLDWVINGGESGHHKRPFNTDWGRKLRDDCKSKEVPFFFKQIDKIQEIPNDLMIREFPNTNNLKIKKMNTDMNLTDLELQVVHNALNGSVIDLESLNWTYNFMQDILSEAEYCERTFVKVEDLFRKLFLMTDSQLLQLIVESQIFWGAEGDIEFLELNILTPTQKFLGTGNSKDVSKYPLDFDDDTMTELEFLMMSQTTKNEFVVFSVSDEGFELLRWSVNKNNINKLLDKLVDNEVCFKVKKLNTIKESIFE